MMGCESVVSIEDERNAKLDHWIVLVNYTTGVVVDSMRW
jgi:hypothetical protein